MRTVNWEPNQVNHPGLPAASRWMNCPTWCKILQQLHLTDKLKCRRISKRFLLLIDSLPSKELHIQIDTDSAVVWRFQCNKSARFNLRLDRSSKLFQAIQWIEFIVRSMIWEEIGTLSDLRPSWFQDRLLARDINNNGQQIVPSFKSVQSQSLFVSSTKIINKTFLTNWLLQNSQYKTSKQSLFPNKLKYRTSTILIT